MKTVTARKLRYARGYIELGLFNEAADELEGIEYADRFHPDVMAARIEVHLAAKQWAMVVDTACDLARKAPTIEVAWIHWAYALRELDRIAEAKAVLIEAEPRHGKSSALLHYNLACYHCLLEERREARKELKTAFAMDPELRSVARDDSDLKAIVSELDLL